MLRWHNWLNEMRKKDEEKRMEVGHQQLVSRMIRSAEGETCLLCKKSPNQQLGEEECRF